MTENCQGELPVVKMVTAKKGNGQQSKMKTIQSHNQDIIRNITIIIKKNITSTTSATTTTTNNN